MSNQREKVAESHCRGKKIEHYFGPEGWQYVVDGTEFENLAAARSHCKHSPLVGSAEDMQAVEEAQDLEIVAIEQPATLSVSEEPEAVDPPKEYEL